MAKRRISSPIKPWDRQDKESVPAFAAFAMYRDWPYLFPGENRSGEKVGERLGKSSTLIDKWRSKNNWVERAREYDVDRDQKKQDAFEREIVEATRKHIKQAQVLQGLAAQGLRAKEEDVKSGNITFRDLLRYAQIGFQMERKALGIPDRVDVTSDGEEIQYGAVILPRKKIVE